MESYRFAAGAGTVVIEADEPAPRLPAELASPGNEVWRRSEDGAIVGSGPFRLEEFEPGHSAAFLAFEKHWEGRPFLDGVVVQMGRDLREQEIALELGKADIVEVSLEEVKRTTQRGARVVLTKPLELMALVLSPGSGSRLTSRLGAAMAVAIDRGAIHRVLLQRLGEEAWALVPGWMSGYAFLFAEKRDISRARALAGEAGALSESLDYAIDADDPLAKAIVERIALDAQAAGIRIRAAASPTAQPDLRLARLPIGSADVGQALAETAGRLRLAAPEASRLESPQRQFEAERDLLRDRMVLPLFHLPQAYGLSKRLRAEDPDVLFEPGAWRLDRVWIEGTAPTEAGENR